MCARVCICVEVFVCWLHGCVCLHICVSGFVHICICVESVCEQTFVERHKYLLGPIYMYFSMCICMWSVCICVCMFVHVCLCFVYSVHMSVYSCAWVCSVCSVIICVYVCIYMYLCFL